MSLDDLKHRLRILPRSIKLAADFTHPEDEWVIDGGVVRKARPKGHEDIPSFDDRFFMPMELALDYSNLREALDKKGRGIHWSIENEKYFVVRDLFEDYPALSHEDPKFLLMVILEVENGITDNINFCT